MEVIIAGVDNDFGGVEARLEVLLLKVDDTGRNFAPYDDVRS